MHTFNKKHIAKYTKIFVLYLAACKLNQKGHLFYCFLPKDVHIAPGKVWLWHGIAWHTLLLLGQNEWYVTLFSQSDCKNHHPLLPIHRTCLQIHQFLQSVLSEQPQLLLTDGDMEAGTCNKVKRNGIEKYSTQSQRKLFSVSLKCVHVNEWVIRHEYSLPKKS